MAKMKYGLVRPNTPVMQTEPLGVSASTAFKAKGGGFVWMDGGYLTLAASGQGTLFGYIDSGDLTAESTDGHTKLSVIVDKNAIFEIPSDATFTAAELLNLLGDTCDLVISTYQYADIGESNEDVIRIVGGDVVEQTVYVQMVSGTLENQGIS